jgi:hypothetical protein
MLVRFRASWQASSSSSPLPPCRPGRATPLGYDTAATPSDVTLDVFAGVGERLVEVAGEQIDLDAKARILAELRLDRDALGWNGRPRSQRHNPKASDQWSRIDVEHDLFVRLRRVLRGRAERGVVAVHRPD